MNNAQPVLNYYNLSDDVKAFSTTRHGGVSEGNYASLNINEYCGDSKANTDANRLLLANELGIDANHIIMPHQTHGVESRIIGEEFATLPDGVKKMLLEGVDAVMTNIPGMCIGVSTADCIPVLLYDEEHHAAAAIHAGWRGTQARIVHKTVQEMRMAYQTDPTKLKAVIGPGISLDNFEVGDEVYAAFEQAAFDMSTIAEERIKRNPNADDPAKAFERKWHINLPLANIQMLTHNGVDEANIINTGICTFDNADNYFSARKLGIESGRIYTGIIIR
ncbi:MAG: peptidoglycan editing factor PgeF [Prevotella sp.]|uniref:peptidoglycan editing factor PgeF n=1 Tax=Prevotella sp. TaxID=59823 RepID=UPI0025F9F38C|nr:peptidoglycan editing factor PgeF [Prevotella sp.]MCI7119549.1 peptidoglycan editing factor PgeF [Prevotella sp.]